MPNESSGSVTVYYPRASREELVAVLQERLIDLTGVLPVKRAILFGSWANGRATAFSDVDVLIVYADPPRDDAYKLAWQYLRIRGLEPHVYSETEAAGLEPTLDRMTRDGVDLLA